MISKDCPKYKEKISFAGRKSETRSNTHAFSQALVWTKHKNIDAYRHVCIARRQNIISWGRISSKLYNVKWEEAQSPSD